MDDVTRRAYRTRVRQKLSALGRVLKREKRLRVDIKNARLECFSLAAAMHFALRFTGCITVRLVTVICSTFLFTIVIIVSTLPVSLSSIWSLFLFMPTSFTTSVHPIDSRVFSSNRMIQIARTFAICGLYRLAIKLYVCYFTIILLHIISLHLAVNIFVIFAFNIFLWL